MKISEITENKPETLQNSISENVIFNRFDLRYDDYLLFNVNEEIIPIYKKKSTLKLGLFNRNIDKNALDAFCKHLFYKYANIDFIEIENCLCDFDDLMPNILYSLDKDKVGGDEWLNIAKVAAEKFQQEQGKYSIIHTERPARDDRTHEDNVTQDDPDFKPRIHNMDIVQFRFDEKTQAMLLVSITDDVVVFEHITSNYNYSKTYDIELVLCMEAILTFFNSGKRKIFLNGTASELKRRLNADKTKTYSGTIWRKNKLYKLAKSLAKLPYHKAIKSSEIACKFISNPIKKKNFKELIATNLNDNFKLAKKGVWFDFYETKEDSDFSSFEYFNHETSKNYIETVLKHMPVKCGNGFMDIGCGTGYVMYKMSSKFKNVYGIELNKKWIDVANDNMAKLGIKNCEILNKDINLVPSEFFDNAEVFYMFNPFIGNTMKGVAKKIEESFNRKKRKGYLIYINALDRKFFDEINIFKVHKVFTHNYREHVIYKIGK